MCVCVCVRLVDFDGFVGVRNFWQELLSTLYFEGRSVEICEKGEILVGKRVLYFTGFGLLILGELVVERTHDLPIS